MLADASEPRLNRSVSGATFSRFHRWQLVLLFGGALVFLIGCLVVVPRLLYPPLSSTDLRGVADPRTRIELQQAQDRLANDARSTVLQALGGLLVAAGAVATWRQLFISREGQLTERFTRAVDQLGSPNVDVRIGGIYALERIAENSAADRNPIQFLLGAFIRTHAPWPADKQTGPDTTGSVDASLPWMRTRAPDIQAAMGTLGRRAPAANPEALYLSRVDLRSVALRNADLRGAKLTGANLGGAIVAGARSDATTAWPAGFDRERRRELGVIDVAADGSGSPAAP